MPVQATTSPPPLMSLEKAHPVLPTSSPQPTSATSSNMRIPSYYELHQPEISATSPPTTVDPAQSPSTAGIPTSSAGRASTDTQESNDDDPDFSQNNLLLAVAALLAVLSVFAVPEAAYGLLSRGTSTVREDPYAALHSVDFTRWRGGLSLLLFFAAVGVVVVLRYCREFRRVRRIVRSLRPFVLRIIVYAVTVCLALGVAVIAMACTPGVSLGTQGDVAGVEAGLLVAAWVVVVLLDKVVTMAYRDVVSSDRDSDGEM